MDPSERAAVPDPIAARTRRRTAIAWGIACHGLFLLGSGAMIAGLFTGMRSGVGALSGGWAWLADGLLLAQFPVLHSALLTRPGRRLLRRLAPGWAGGALDTTLFAAAASVQVLAVFLLWSPLGSWRWAPGGALFWGSAASYAAAWLVMGKAVWDTGLGAQLGYTGWLALWRGERPAYPEPPRGGLYRYLRHPVYAAMIAVLWTGPVWTLDHLLLAAPLTAYCVIGPRFKEARHARRAAGGVSATSATSAVSRRRPRTAPAARPGGRLSA